MNRFATFILALLIVRATFADDAVPNDPAPRWWRGNIHTHSLWSDGDDFPEMISEWYRTNGYHFLAMSDHNILAAGMRWMGESEIKRRGGEVTITDYFKRYGDDWVETRMLEDGKEREFRLKSFNEYRSLLEERGRFILLQGEEISDAVEGQPVHMNATNLKEAIAPLGGETVPQAIEANLRAVEAQAKKTGREIIVHVNHPSFYYAISAEQLAEVVSERFFEVYNGNTDVNHLGDDDHPSVEAIWDIANAIRITRFGAAPLFGVATDDSHHYHGGGVQSPGRGWIMVRARHLTPESLILAMKRGDFYASSGVTLTEVAYDAGKKTLSVVIDGDADTTYETKFIGTKKAENASKQIDPAKAGIVLQSSKGTKATYQMTGDELYVRAQVVSSRAHPNPSFENQFEEAWTQPVGWTATELKK